LSLPNAKRIASEQKAALEIIPKALAVVAPTNFSLLMRVTTRNGRRDRAAMKHLTAVLFPLNTIRFKISSTNETTYVCEST
jgi:hypothetical protein